MKKLLVTLAITVLAQNSFAHCGKPLVNSIQDNGRNASELAFRLLDFNNEAGETFVVNQPQLQNFLLMAVQTGMKVCIGLESGSNAVSSISRN